MASAATVIVFFIVSSFMNSSYIARENIDLSWLFIAFALHNCDGTITAGDLDIYERAWITNP